LNEECCALILNRAAISSHSGRESSSRAATKELRVAGEVEKAISLLRCKPAGGNGAVCNSVTPRARQQTVTAYFSKFSHAVAHAAGTPTAFFLAVVTIIAWAITGPVFGYSDTWQLVINTGTTIVTFLMVFLIQNTQNRDALAVQLKLSELIIAVKDAENRIATIEDLPEEDLEQLHKELCARAEQAGDALASRRSGKRQPT
jgi:low affinity Fe/Cu permease